MLAIAIVLIILWILSLWLLLLRQRRPVGLLSLPPFALVSGTVLFFLLSLAGMIFFRLLLP
jgi:hypothetical protein